VIKVFINKTVHLFRTTKKRKKRLTMMKRNGLRSIVATRT